METAGGHAHSGKENPTKEAQARQQNKTEMNSKKELFRRTDKLKALESQTVLECKTKLEGRSYYLYCCQESTQEEPFSHWFNLIGLQT